jgi:hypothetical protein
MNKPSTPTASQKRFCSMPITVPRPLPPGIAGERQRAIVITERKWVNGTRLKYAFFSGGSWSGGDALKTQAREAFKRWSDLGIGLIFEEVPSPASASIRIGFQPGDGHWSYVGRDILAQGANDRTMNLDPLDAIEGSEYGVNVACHEIGHTMGFPHEHQNPKAGITWNEEAVYAALAAPPNGWSREQTYHNIIRKIAPDQIQGSAWDPDSVMHYPFDPGLILKPEQYLQTGIQPPGGISARDREWVKTFYPSLTSADETELPQHESRRLQIGAGQQRNFIIRPSVSRTYELRTFGTSDTVMVLFTRDPDGRDRYLTADDDSGQDRNAHIRRRLLAGRTYVVRLRLYYAADVGETSFMWW